jgi:hypothetical protein
MRVRLFAVVQELNCGLGAPYSAVVHGSAKLPIGDRQIRFVTNGSPPVVIGI